ncbi:hypothetical protein APED_18805 [Acanthopleuribacter pedis]
MIQKWFPTVVAVLFPWLLFTALNALVFEPPVWPWSLLATLPVSMLMVGCGLLLPHSSRVRKRFLMLGLFFCWPLLRLISIYQQEIVAQVMAVPLFVGLNLGAGLLSGWVVGRCFSGG